MKCFNKLMCINHNRGSWWMWSRSTASSTSASHNVSSECSAEQCSPVNRESAGNAKFEFEKLSGMNIDAQNKLKMDK